MCIEKCILRTSSIFSVFAVVLLLTGCAFGDRQATLSYPPKSSADESDTHAYTAIQHEPKNIAVIVKPFTDNRTDKSRVGTVRNGFGMQTANVIPRNSVTDWVTDGLRSELKNYGYTVITENSHPSQTVVEISGETLNVFCDMYFNYMGEVSIIARVKKDDEELFNKHYNGEGSVGLAWAGTGDSFSASLSLALATVLREFLKDLDQAVAGKE